MKACPRCRSEYPDDALFCAECGASLAETPTASATPAATLSEAAPSSAPLDETPAPAETPSALLSEAPFISAEQPASAASPQAIYGNPPALPILIENNTPFTKQTLKDFYKNLKILGIVCLILGVWCVIAYFLFRHLTNQNDFVFLWVGLAAILCGILYLFLSSAYVTKNKLVTDSTYEIYQCDEQQIHCYSFDRTQKIAESHIGYEKISHASQNKKYILLRVGAVVELVNRATFTIGTEEEFKDLLRAKCGPKIARFPKK